MTLLVGVDGCPAGWLCVLWNDASPCPHEARIVRTAQELLAAFPTAAVMAVDIPIGLVDHGLRRADVEARDLLGARRSCVFDSPIRPALDAPSRLVADLITREHSGRGVTTQGWEMSHKVRNMDRAITPAHQRWCFEIHPELSFMAWNGGTPLPDSKKSDEGLAARTGLIDARWPGSRDALAASLEATPGEHWSLDDLHDAFAALWTAARILSGTAQRIPSALQVDSRGLRCEIWR
jgi:predicted RNase H-like nuclease